MERLHLVAATDESGAVSVKYFGNDRAAARQALETPGGVKTELFAFLTPTARKKWEPQERPVKKKA